MAKEKPRREKVTSTRLLDHRFYRNRLLGCYLETAEGKLAADQRVLLQLQKDNKRGKRWWAPIKLVELVELLINAENVG